MTRPTLESARASAVRPGTPMPSSFVTRIVVTTPRYHMTADRRTARGAHRMAPARSHRGAAGLAGRLGSGRHMPARRARHGPLARLVEQAARLVFPILRNPDLDPGERRHLGHRQLGGALVDHLVRDACGVQQPGDDVRGLLARYGQQDRPVILGHADSFATGGSRGHPDGSRLWGAYRL